MQQNSEILDRVEFLTGSSDIVGKLPKIKTLQPFDNRIIEFLNDVSKELMNNKEAKAFSDVITFAFMIRKGALKKLQERFDKADVLRLGKGVVFHIAPSNVPVNFAYSLFVGLLTGNANVVRVPSKEFAQIAIITNAFNKVLEHNEFIKPYLICVRYDRDKEINDFFSSISDMRIVWGGDQTIEELRKSALPPRAGEITFADRYSLAVIDSDYYMHLKDKSRVAEDFCNDTFLSDQNACTSPHAIIWTGDCIAEAKEVFWEEEQRFAEQKYDLQPVQVISKYTQALKYASETDNVRIVKAKDNLIVRVDVPQIKEGLMSFHGNSGLFFEYDCRDILEILPLCDDKRCQTIGYLGNYGDILPLVESGIRGIDRIVPIGRTMDFDFIWDGYDLPAMLTRTIAVF